MPKKKRKYLKGIQAQVHLHPGVITVSVEVPWSDIERRLHIKENTLQDAAKRLFRKGRARKQGKKRFTMAEN
jgi:hypothetical protein